MDLIEKAAEKLERRSGGSLIERAAEKMGTAPAATAPPPPPPAPEAPPAAAARPAPGAPAPPPAADRAAPKRVYIDLDRLFAAGMVTPRGERTRIAEEYRVIKRPLLLKAMAPEQGGVENGNLIMVSSAVPEEGKTFTAINLAMSIAKERDLYVMLVDADLSRPNVANTLGIETEKGFVDVLEDASMDVSQVMLRTNVENFSIIPAGRPHPMGTELLASERAASVIGEIAHRYKNRIIIFDTAPVLASSEGGALARFVGQVLFVVEAEKTPAAAVRSAADMLAGCRHVGLVLNKARSSLSGSRFGGYYGYYYRESY